jgi:Cd2+/Zn2+-exporting ATPase
VGTEGLGDAHEIPLAARLVYALGIVAGLFTVAPKAWLAVRRLRPDMNLLMTIAVAGAILIGEWFEAATVSFLFAFSLALESWSIGRARRAIAKLLDLVPPTARLVTEDGEKEVDPALVPVGSRIAVRPGERLPLDGRVVAGRSTANQAPITGESRPIDKAPGDEVYAGSSNGSGAIEIETTAAAEATMLAKILRLVEEAQARRSPSERWVDRFAAIYTPVVFGLAIAVGLLPPLVAGGSWNEWGYRALVLLVIGCPCALVVSTPVAIVAGLAAAARHGVLIKGGLFLEAPARIRPSPSTRPGRSRTVVPGAGGDSTRGTTSAGSGGLAALEARSEHPLRSRFASTPLPEASRQLLPRSSGRSRERVLRASWTDESSGSARTATSRSAARRRRRFTKSWKRSPPRAARWSCSATTPTSAAWLRSPTACARRRARRSTTCAGSASKRPSC